MVINLFPVKENFAQKVSNNDSKILYENNYLNVTKSFQQTILTSWDPGDFPHVYLQAPPTPTLQPACLQIHMWAHSPGAHDLHYMHSMK